jgi:hypothetical protein
MVESVVASQGDESFLLAENFLLDLYITSIQTEVLKDLCYFVEGVMGNVVDLGGLVFFT